MTRAARPLLLLAALAAAASACGGGRPTPDDFLAIVPQVVALMEEDGRRNQLGRPSDGPLWVDGRAFATVAAQVTRETLSPDTIVARAGRGNDAYARQVLICEEQGLIGGCWVREYGVFVSPNVGRATADQITMIVVNYTTDRRDFPTEICDRAWRLRFRRGEGGRWGLAERELRATCQDPRRDR